MFILLYLVVHYASGPSNSLFGFIRGMDGNICFQFQGQASLFSEGSTPERNALILGGDEHTLRIIISTVMLEGKIGWSIKNQTSYLEMQPHTLTSNYLSGKANGSIP